MADALTVAKNGSAGITNTSANENEINATNINSLRDVAPASPTLPCKYERTLMLVQVCNSIP